MSLAWEYMLGAGDENRTRTISLGSAAVTAARGADRVAVPVPSDRGCPLVTLVNGPLMARPPCADLGDAEGSVPASPRSARTYRSQAVAASARR